MTTVNLTKYHGCGNDFLIISLQELTRVLPSQEWPNFAEAVCNRHFGIGADGLLVVGKPNRSEEFGNVRMTIFNSDGSQAQMCGNGIRCAAHYAIHQGWTQGLKFTIDTAAGPKGIEVVRDNFRVNMGPPSFDPTMIPVEDFVLGSGAELPVVWIRQPWASLSPYFAVSMGNPHAVLFMGLEDEIALDVLGPRIESHKNFPNNTNVEFAHVVDEHHAKVLVWERGAGATLACGTGACAVAAVGIKLGELESPVQVELPGGTLTIEWDGQGDMNMTGPVRRVAEVQYYYQGGSKQ